MRNKKRMCSNRNWKINWDTELSLKYEKINLFLEENQLHYRQLNEIELFLNTKKETNDAIKIKHQEPMKYQNLLITSNWIQIIIYSIKYDMESEGVQQRQEEGQ